jgi:hypothetical protein
VTGTIAASPADDQPIAPGKFIPTFAIDYGAVKDLSPDEAARFDLIDAGAHSRSDTSIWLPLKKRNPHLKVFIYQLGPSEYNAESKFPGEQAWSWITANHGASSADRWTAIGSAYGDYLQSHDYKSERLMIVGNPAWQRYWLEGVTRRVFSPTSPNRDADGIFADNTNYEMPPEGWYRQNHPDEPDSPTDYFRNGVYQGQIWKAQAKQFIATAVPWLANQRHLLILNFGYLAREPQNWRDADALPQPPFGSMEEGAFAHPWGGNGHCVFYDEQGWLHQVDTLRHLKHMRALMSVHCPIVSPNADLSRLDFTDVGGANRGADILWFGITSFLQGYDDVRQNGYLGFTIWGYVRGYWMDEFDPARLNLGRAVGESHRVDAASGHCYLREFESGWAAVNPTATDARGVPIPTGQARVLDHYTFEHADAQPLVWRFDLPAHRGVILLKPGRRVGSADAPGSGDPHRS